MKNSILCFLLSFIFFSCSKPNEDSATEIIPSAPSALTGKLTGNTQVTLNWKDNSNNETGFKVERKTGNGNYAQVAEMGADIIQYTDKGLAANTSYTYRVIAYNTTGTNYSNETSITIYSTVTIGTQNWMQKNLEVDHYRNGDPIPQVSNPTEWATLTTGAWCYYANNTASGVIYGKLYNWYAVNDPRGLAPQGWHVATNAEWTTLTTYLGGLELAGGPMKALENWTSNVGASNSSGFTAYGNGFRNNQGTFSNLGILGTWWTADNDNGDISFYRVLYNSNTKSEGYHNFNTFGLGVRCVRD